NHALRPTPFGSKLTADALTRLCDGNGMYRLARIPRHDQLAKLVAPGSFRGAVPGRDLGPAAAAPQQAPQLPSHFLFPLVNRGAASRVAPVPVRERGGWATVLA